MPVSPAVLLPTATALRKKTSTCLRRMRVGEFADGEKTLRAKIDLASPNMNLRDPAIYRIKHVSHHARAISGASTPCMTLPTPFRTPLRASPIPCAAWNLRTTAPCMSGS